MKSGVEFEKLTEKIFHHLVKDPAYEKVEHNVLIQGKDGERQIDVLITSEMAGIKITTVIECKDFKSKVSVGVVDALHSKMSDINANKGVIVTARGFSKTAISKAKRLGISLYTAHEALHEKWSIDFEIPVLITEITPYDIRPNFYIQMDQGSSIQGGPDLFVNDISVVDDFKEYWQKMSANEIFLLKRNGNRYINQNIKPPFFLRDYIGGIKQIENFSIKFDTKKNFFFGFIHEQSDVMALKDVIDNNFKIIFKPDCFINYEQKFTKISEKEIPCFHTFKIECLAKPSIGDFLFDNFNLYKVKA